MPNRYRASELGLDYDSCGSNEFSVNTMYLTLESGNESNCLSDGLKIVGLMIFGDVLNLQQAPGIELKFIVKMIQIVMEI